GERRKLVDQHYATLDFTDPLDVKKLLSVIEQFLSDAYAILDDDEQAYLHLAMTLQIPPIIEQLRKDGYHYENGRITSGDDISGLKHFNDKIVVLDARQLRTLI